MSDEESSATGSEGAEQEEWEEWSGDESSGFRSLFDDRTFGSLQEVARHDAGTHGFDLLQFRRQLALDHYDTIRCINYIRGEVATGRDPRPALQAAAASAGSSGVAPPWHGDGFLQPVLPDDELLFHDWEEEALEAGPSGAPGAGGAGSIAAPGLQQEVARLREENAALRAALEAMQSLVLQDEAVRELVADAALGAAADDAGPSSGSAKAGEQQQPPQQEQQATSEKALIDSSYFDSYSTFDIHRDMLADKASAAHRMTGPPWRRRRCFVRTEAYRDAMERNPRLLRGARVLDVGCGTGILSMFAARGGAAAVVGVDGSEAIAAHARANIEANDLAGTVSVVHSRVEELAELPLPAEAHGKVDVLVSEWMGYALFFESMLDSVLSARDRFLRPGGALLPDTARLFLAPAAPAATGIPFWDDVYGFAMPGVAAALHSSALREVVVRQVAAEHVLGEGVEVRAFDLATMAPPDQDFTADFRLTVGAGPVEVGALVLWFDTLFTERFCGEAPGELSTSPFGPPTHWGQAVLALRTPVRLAPAGGGPPPGAAVALAGQLSMARSVHRHRSLDVALTYRAVAADGSKGEVVSLIYAMGVHTG
eukprot:scaffold8.g1499.t1